MFFNPDIQHAGTQGNAGIYSSQQGNAQGFPPAASFSVGPSMQQNNTGAQFVPNAPQNPNTNVPPRPVQLRFDVERQNYGPVRKSPSPPSTHPYLPRRSPSHSPTRKSPPPSATQPTSQNNGLRASFSPPHVSFPQQPGKEFEMSQFATQTRNFQVQLPLQEKPLPRATQSQVFFSTPQQQSYQHIQQNFAQTLQYSQTQGIRPNTLQPSVQPAIFSRPNEALPQQGLQQGVGHTTPQFISKTRSQSPPPSSNRLGNTQQFSQPQQNGVSVTIAGQVQNSISNPNTIQKRPSQTFSLIGRPSSFIPPPPPPDILKNTSTNKTSPLHNLPPQIPQRGIGTEVPMSQNQIPSVQGQSPQPPQIPQRGMEVETPMIQNQIPSIPSQSPQPPQIPRQGMEVETPMPQNQVPSVQTQPPQPPQIPQQGFGAEVPMNQGTLQNHTIQIHIQNNQPPQPQNFQPFHPQVQAQPNFQQQPQNMFGSTEQPPQTPQMQSQPMDFIANISQYSVAELDSIYTGGTHNRQLNDHNTNIEWTMESVQEMSRYTNSDRAIEENAASVINKPWDYASYIRFLSADKKSQKCLRVIAAVFTTNYLKNTNVKQKYTNTNQFGGKSFVAYADRPTPQQCVPKMLVGTENIGTYQGQRGDTNVQVVVEDCIDYVHRAQIEGGKVAYMFFGDPLLLGGGWKEGCTGCEEDVFIRTAFSDTFSRGGYILTEHTALYTEDVPVLRAGEECGFAFYDAGRMWKLNAVTLAGIERARPLTTKDAIDLAVRLEVALCGCLRNGVQQLVIGWLDTDTRTTVSAARVFREVLYRFAGLFTRVAIVAKTPEEKNFIARELFATDKTLTKYRCVGSYMAPSVNDTKSQVCCEGGLCTHTDPAHYAHKRHPPPCPLGEQCTCSDRFHTLLFMHRRKCPRGACCHLMYAKDRTVSIEHEKLFSHPQRCPNGAFCNNADMTHMSTMMHPPPCVLGANCPSLRDPTHSQMWRHNMRTCPDGTRCNKVFDAVHNWVFWHNRMPICNDTPYECSNKDRKHFARYAHACKFGPCCQHIGNPEHERNFVHAGERCSIPNCGELDEGHLRSCFHQDHSPFRPQCIDPGCCNTTRMHRFKITHSPWWIPECAVTMATCRSLVPDQSDADNFANSLPFRADFHNNSLVLLSTLNTYLGQDIQANSQEYSRIKDWVSSLRPTIACSEKEALTALKLGFFVSRPMAKSLLESGESIADVAVRHNRVLRDIAKASPSHKKWIRMYAAMCAKLYISVENPSFTEREGITRAKNELERNFGINGDAIHNEIREVVSLLREFALSSSAPLSFNSKSIDNAVTGVLGPHMGNVNGPTDVIFVLRAGITHHPDFFVLPTAAALYGSPGYRANRENWAGPGKTWNAADSTWQGDANRDLLIDRLSPADPLFAEVITKELIARALGRYQGRNMTPQAITFNDVFSMYWEKERTPYLFEAHFPLITPIECVEGAVANTTKRAAMEGYFKKENITVEFANNPISVCFNKFRSLQTGAPWLLAPQGFHLAVTGASEHHVPITLDEDTEAVEISFRACCWGGGNLCITLSNVGDTKCSTAQRKCITFVLSGNAQNVAVYKHLPSVCLSANTPQADAVCDHFNDGCQFRGFIEYKIVADYKSKTVTLSHSGGSAIYNNCSVTTSVDLCTRYSYISFSTSEDGVHPPVVTDLVTEARGPGGYKAFFPPACVIPQYRTFMSTPYNLAPPPPFGSKNTLKTMASGNIWGTGFGGPATGGGGGFGNNNGGGFGGFGGPSIDDDDDDDDDDDMDGRLPLCQDPFSCAILSENQFTSHKAEYAHICRKGVTCPKINDPSHCKEFYHLVKEECPEGNFCKKLEDPEHRLKYHHPFKQDYLIKCKYGMRCYDIHNYYHSCSYHHDPNFKYDINSLRFKEFSKPN